MINILLIEDEWIIASDIKSSLALGDYAIVQITKNYVEAKLHFIQNHYDLIISDVKLNDVKDGIEIIAEFNKIKSIPVVYLTAFSDSETINRIEKTQPYAYLLKPYNINQLKTTINLTLQNFYKNNENSIYDKENLSKIKLLTQREKEVLITLSSGKLSKEIAETLNISVNTVEQHKKNIKKKLELTTVGELVNFALSTNLT